MNISNENEYESPLQRPIWFTNATYIVLCMVPLAIILGIPGNATVILVYYSKSVKCCSDILIISLGCIDCFTCLVYLPFTWLVELLHLHGFSTPRIFCLFDHVTSRCVTLASVGVLLAVTIDRYLAVCKPYFYRTALKPDAAILVCILILAISFSISVPSSFLCFGMVDFWKNYTELFNKLHSGVILTSILIIIVTFFFIVRAVIQKVSKRKLNSNNMPAQSFSEMQSNVTDIGDISTSCTCACVIQETSFNRQGSTKSASNIKYESALSPERCPSIQVNHDEQCALFSKGCGRRSSSISNRSYSVQKKRRHCCQCFSLPKLKLHFRKSEQRLLAMLLLAAFSFIALYLPCALLNSGLLSLKNSELSFYMFAISNCIFWYHFACNPLIYAAVSPRFREESMNKIFRRN